MQVSLRILKWEIVLGFQMGFKCNHMYPYRREAKGDLTHTEVTVTT